MSTVKDSKRIIKWAVIVAGVLAVFYMLFFRCQVSDRQAILTAQQFMQKHDIRINAAPSFSDLNYIGFLMSGLLCEKKKKTLTFGDDFTYSPLISIDCDSGEVIMYKNHAILQNLAKKYQRITPKVGSSYTDWPAFMSENDARRVADSIAMKIPLPADMSFEGLKKYMRGADHDKDGLWIATWRRSLNGYSYEFDRVTIGIVGFSGQFVQYEKIYEGTKCSTGVKISREKATEIGWDKLKEKIDKERRAQTRDAYDITSVKLLIVRPNVLFGCSVPYRSRTSRLAWVIKFGIKDGPEVWKYMKMPPMDYEVRVDAFDGRYLGGTEDIFLQK